jgi:hypothetical protein
MPKNRTVQSQTFTRSVTHCTAAVFAKILQSIAVLPALVRVSLEPERMKLIADSLLHCGGPLN